MASLDLDRAAAARDALLGAARAVGELAQGGAAARHLIAGSHGPRVAAWLDAALRIEREQRALCVELRRTAQALDDALFAAARAAGRCEQPAPRRGIGQAPIAW